MVITCIKCKTELRIDAKKVDVSNSVIRCPKCKAEFKLNLNATSGSASDSSDSEERTKMESSNLATGWIVVHDEQTKPRVFPLKLGRNVIGRKSRSRPCDIMIDTKDMYMSRNHCAIHVGKSPKGDLSYLIKCVKSLNGTFINEGKKGKLNLNDEIYLEDKDTIQLGRTKVVLKKAASCSSAEKAMTEVAKTSYAKTVVFNPSGGDNITYRN